MGFMTTQMIVNIVGGIGVIAIIVGCGKLYDWADARGNR